VSEMAEAKDLGRSESDSGFPINCLEWTGDGVEKGLEGVKAEFFVEKGFAEDDWDNGLAPNSVSPRLVLGGNR
jgi:hypothetical protein